MIQRKINQYVRQWKRKGYPEDISDVVPEGLMHDNLAPSYKAVALAILKNDHQLTTLGFSPLPSPWYYAIKQNEFREKARR